MAGLRTDRNEGYDWSRGARETALIWRKPACVGANWGPMAALFRPLAEPRLPQHRAMQPELERSDQVVARVVAWHNRHPLATRISADQVHSVGVVSLPFAVQGAEVQAHPTPAPVQPPPAPPVDPTPEAAVELAIETPEALAAAHDTPGADGPDLSQAALDAAADAVPAALSAPPETQPEPLPQPMPEPLRSTLPPRPPSWHPLTWWRRWRGDDPFRALFSEDFIEPLRPRRVARWAAAHGAGHPPLAADAPRRRVALDAQRRREDAGATEVELHVITAAIGIGDQRLRLLLAPGAGGAILGPRHWSRPRMVGAAAVLLALMLPLAALPWLRGGADAPAAAAASAAVTAMAAASAPAATVAASAPASSPPEPAAAAPAWPAPPPDVPPQRGRIDIGPLVPRLADAERQQLRRHGRDLRGEQPVRAEDKAWALVTAPLDRRRAERAALQLQAVALFQPVPMRVERMPAGQQWRAVFWPFTSAQDAEKVRLALADKGLQTEVLEF